MTPTMVAVEPVGQEGIQTLRCPQTFQISHHIHKNQVAINSYKRGGKIFFSRFGIRIISYLRCLVKSVHHCLMCRLLHNILFISLYTVGG